MRLVLDNNVAVSGLLWGGPSNYLLRAVREGRAKVFVTDELLNALTEVLGRSKFSARLAERGDAPESLARLFTDATFRVEPAILTGVRIRDKDDIAVLACAVSAKANLIVSGDDDLLVLKSFADIPIVKPIQAARTLGYQG